MSDRIAIISDIHANLEALSVVLEKAREQEVTKYICLGDIVGYNANPKECLDIVRGLEPLAVIRGNHDEYIGSEQELNGFNAMASFAVQWTRGKLSAEDRQWLATRPYSKNLLFSGTDYQPLQVVHGTLDNPKMWGYVFNRFSAMSCMECQLYNLCFCGHTHVPGIFVRQGYSTLAEVWEDGRVVELKPNTRYLFNVGSVGQPRDNDPRAAFVIYDQSQNTVQMYRLEYDIEAAQQKILDAGLPENLAARLAVGR